MEVNVNFKALDINNNQIFFTDSNGLGKIERILN